MRLGDWLQKHGFTQKAFADAIGVTQGRVAQLCKGGENPPISLIAKIEAATGGDVTAQDFMPDVDVQPLRLAAGVVQ